MQMASSPLVSVVIATRDRPGYLARLLQCIREQDLADFECIVVDDGSSAETIAAYDGIWRGLDERFLLHLREPGDRKAGGASRTRNRGINLARGEFVAFCDDDDLWLRNDHLSTGANALRRHGGDLYFADLQMTQNKKIVRPNFYTRASKYLTHDLLAGESDIFELAQSGKTKFFHHHILHCNTTIATRRLLVDCGLYWELLPVTVDRDFGLRIFDHAKKILYRSTVSADYDTTPHASLYQSYTTEESNLFAIVGVLHAETVMRSAAMRRVARRNRAWYLVELAQAALSDGRSGQARGLAMQSLLLRPTGGAAKLLAKSLLGSNVEVSSPKLEV